MSNFNFVATTLSGLEKTLEDEIQQLGGENILPLRRAVKFSGSFGLMYKMNFSLRTALRILWKIKTFRIKSDSDLYQGIYKIPWEDFFLPSQTFAIQSVVNSQIFTNSHYAALKAKDGIVDRLRDKTGRRPNVELRKPDFLLNLHIDKDFVDVSLDSSGDPLFKRGYRTESIEAPLNEVLAAGMIRLAGWDGRSDFLDLMCGSGTLAIEAAMIALNIPPGVFRASYGFQKWKDYDEELYRKIAETQMHGKEFEYKIYASDISVSAFRTAQVNLQKAMLEDIVILKHSDFFKTTAFSDKGLLILNPPYGERIKQYRINEFYRKIGDHLKSEFAGHEAWLLSANNEALKSVGLKPSRKIPLMNGSLECKFNQYELFSGKRNEYLSSKN